MILDETRKKFLVVREDNGTWELPGGGLDWGESPEMCLRRELHEEMGLTITYMNTNPSYFLTFENQHGTWIANVLFEIKVKDLNFIPPEECQEIKFVLPEEVDSMNAFNNVKKLAEVFDSEKHK